MNIATVAMVLITIALAILAYLKDPPLLAAGAKAGGKMFTGVLVLLAAAFLIAGFIQVLVPREMISRWIGRESGLRGILVACVLGGVTPGGPYVSFPIVAALYKAGAGIGPVVAYVTAWSLWAAGRLPIELGLVGPKVTLVRFLSTFLLPPLAGLIAQTFFSRVA
ncbi:MAG: permease [Terriglobia bacterium]